MKLVLARVLVIGWLACGCGRMGFDPLAGSPPDVAGDEAADAAPVETPLDAASSGTDALVVAPDGASGTGLACVPPDPSSATTFPSGAPCNGWGTVSMVSATVQQTGNGLIVTPSASTFGSEGYCQRASVPYGAAGALLHLGGVLAGPGSVTGFQIGMGSTALELIDDAGNLEAQDGGGTLVTTPYNPTLMSWFWIHPDAAGTGSVFETSPDGLTWTMAAASSQPPPTSVTVTIMAAVLASNDTAPGTAAFKSFDVCPP